MGSYASYKAACYDVVYAECERLRARVAELERALVWAADNRAERHVAWWDGIGDRRVLRFRLPQAMYPPVDTDAGLIRVLIAASKGE